MRSKLAFVVFRKKKKGHKGLKARKRGIHRTMSVAQQEKDDIQAKFAEDRVQIQKEKEQLLAEKIGVKEAVTRALCSMMGLE
jgi:hypothetical protein